MSDVPDDRPEDQCPEGQVPYSYDSEQLPERFTLELVRHMTVRDLRDLEQRDDLTPEQKSSLNDATSEIFAPLREKLSTVVFPKFVTSDFSAAIKQAQKDMIGRFDALKFTAADWMPNFDTDAWVRQTVADLKVTPVPLSTRDVPGVETVSISDHHEVGLEPGPTEVDPDQPVDTAVGEAVHAVDHFAQLARIAALQETQLAILEGQEQARHRERYLTFLVTITVVVAGIFPMVTATGEERVLTAVWAVVIVGGGLGTAWYVGYCKAWLKKHPPKAKG